MRSALTATVLALSLAGCCTVPALGLCPVCPGSPERPMEPAKPPNPFRPVVWKILRDTGGNVETIGLAYEPETAGTPWKVVHVPGVLPFRDTDTIDPRWHDQGRVYDAPQLCEALRGLTMSVQNTLVVGPVFDLNQIVRTGTCPPGQ